jgi:serine/threonine protein kinase/DNA-binding winged helix-turn-helix (wHTH) protein
MVDRGQHSAPAQGPDEARRRWFFGRSLLDERTHELTVDGVDIELERKPLEVLIYLLRHAGEVCTKDELLANVWPGRVLSETVLTKCIGRIREALGDREQEIVKTAYGFGYRFVAPVRVEIASQQPPPHFEFRLGDHPPGRPLWSLIEKLGGGGQGEAWRARHDKTGEQRVFKFALSELALATLKREITLFRVINDTLGANARVVRLLDWNLEQLPYFVESEYVAGGSLVEWVRSRGGATAIPVAERLEIIARIADAVGAVHSVGVLHKDLKPSNILVRPSTAGIPEISLADFGSGGMLDAARLDRLGITRLGFTRTLTTLDANSGTPLYLAPEILAGQPFTVKSDLYALGVVLYQFLVGDFSSVMSPGWERGIDDELLREDIALLAQGNPVDRLGDAEAIARRLRSLDERRTHLAAEREAQAKAERTRRLLERAQARRFGLILAFAALVVGLVVSTTLYFKARRAQQLAMVSAAQSKAVKDFLSEAVFAPVSSRKEPVKDMTVIELLTRAGNEIDVRFASQPDIAAELHYVLGRSFQSFLETALEVKHYRRALELGERLSGQGSRAVARSASELVVVDYLVGQLRDSIGRYETILTTSRHVMGESAPEVLELRLNLAYGYYLLGDWNSAARMFQDMLTDTAASTRGPSELIAYVHFYYGQLLTDLAEPAEAESHLRQAISGFTASLGEKHVMVAEAHSALGLVLSEEGRFTEASRELSEAHALAVQWTSPESWTELRPRFFTALMLLHQDQPMEAEPFLADIIRFQDDAWATYLPTHKDLMIPLDRTGPVRQALGEAYEREGRLTEAVETLERAVTVSERISGPKHPQVLSAKLSLAEALIAGDRAGEARRLVTSVQSAQLSALPPAHPILAQWYRVNGLLDLSEHGVGQARKNLTRALDVFQSAYGREDWRVIRARQDLQRAARTRAEP